MADCWKQNKVMLKWSSCYCCYFYRMWILKLWRWRNCCIPLILNISAANKSPLFLSDLKKWLPWCEFLIMEDNKPLVCMCLCVCFSMKWNCLMILFQIRSDFENDVNIRYSLEGPGANLDPFHVFIVDPQTGFIRVTKVLDREVIDMYNVSDPWEILFCSIYVMIPKYCCFLYVILR